MSLTDLKEQIEKIRTYDDKFQIQFFVKQRRKADKFSVGDILFLMQMRQVDSKAKPLILLSVLDSIYKAFAELIEDLRKFFYDSKTKRLIYISFHTEHLVSDIYLGGMMLDNEGIPDEVFQALYRCLLSHRTLSLDDGLEFRVTIVSIPHTQHLKRKRGQKSSSSSSHSGPIKYPRLDFYRHPRPGSERKIGFKNKNILNLDLKLKNQSKKKSFFNIPKGSYLTPNIFKNSCLVVAFTIAFLFKKSFQDVRLSGIRAKIRKMFSKNYKEQQDSVLYVKNETLKLLRNTNIKYRGPHSLDILPILCNKVHCNIFIFSALKHNQLLYQYPNEYDPYRVPVILFETPSLMEDGITHVDVILNHFEFFSPSVPCLACSQVYSRKRSHKCKFMSTCRNCNRIVLRKDYFYDLQLRGEFCANLMMQNEREHDLKQFNLKLANLPINPVNFQRANTPAMPLVCSYCQKQDFFDPTCFRYHLKNCKKEKVCPDCKQVIQGNSEKGLSKEISKHECYKKECNWCHEMINFSAKNHQCPLQRPKLCSSLPKLVFFDLETILGSDNEHLAYLACSFYESQYHGYFNAIHFGSDNFIHPHLEIIQNGISLIDYLWDWDLPNKILPRHEKRKAKATDDYHYDIFSQQVKKDVADYDKVRFQNYLDALERYGHLDLSIRSSALFKMLCFYLHTDFENYVFIAHGSSRFDNVLLLSMALKMGFTPSVLYAGGSLLSITFKEYQIRCLDSFRYFNMALRKLPAKYNLKASKGFFPFNFLKNETMGYKGPIPLLDYFINPGDNESLIKEKDSYIQEFGNKIYDINNEALAYCIKDVEILQLAVCFFLRQTFRFQNALQMFYGMDLSKKKIPFLHPFQKDFCTIGGLR